MSSPLIRIGKSLLRYFKPARVASPHKKPFTPLSSRDEKKEKKKGQSNPEFQVFQIKKPSADAKPAESKAAENIPIQKPLTQMPEKAHTHWLELVVHLLSVCKLVAEKMKAKIGFEAYRGAVHQQTTRKIKIVGSIIDTGVVEDSAPAAASETSHTNSAPKAAPREKKKLA